MQVIICGAGKVGRSIAQQLILEDHDVTVIDQSEKLIEKINQSLDLNSYVGFASHPSVLENAGAADADMIVAVTQSDEINMIACQVAHSVFNIRTKIARIRSQNYFTHQDLFVPESIPIDVIISPEIEVAKAILDRLHVPGSNETALFADANIKLVSVKPYESASLLGMTIANANKELRKNNAKIIAFSEDQELQISNFSPKINLDMEVFFITEAKAIKTVMAQFGHEETEARKIRIIGGGKIGFYLGQQLEINENNNIKIIERSVNRANYIAEKLFNCTVINGDAVDQEILDEANISSSDSLIAVSNDDEVNILSTLLAKKIGCKKTVALINTSSFSPLFSSLGIDTIINPKEITISSILRYIRSLKVRKAFSLCDSQAEIIETDAFDASFCIGKTVKELSLPKGVELCAIYRIDEVIIPDEKTVIAEKDRLMVISYVEKLKKVEKIFSNKVKYT